jgi:hypothetical protein
MGASQSYDHGRLKAASTCVPSRFKIVSQRVNEKVVKLQQDTRNYLQSQDWQRAYLTASEHYRERNHLSVLQLLELRCELLRGRLDSIKEKSTKPPLDMVPTLDTLVYAAGILSSEIDELAVIKQELLRRYGTETFQHAIHYGNGHKVDDKAYAALGAMSSDPQHVFVRMEMVTIAGKAPAIPFDPECVLLLVSSMLA